MPVGGTFEELGAYFKLELNRFATVVRDSGAKVD